MFVCICLHLNIQKHKIMVEKLLNMKVGETSDFTGENYDVLISTKSRLKRNKKGTWVSMLGKDGLFVKRTS